ncbi:phage terminase large subunit-like protein [Actinokineospora baliensis]|uniref:terminase large subunit domain-containing protein n=1 Tax=Actinokineospora baliensis TaxID=547056 RepID=UPI00195E2181|nr:terminase large subunit [Actinokineospora baliensis]MBM7770635.1 phage terminase large subunit-like protein [Actinokineospora baliensis]
MIGSRTRAPATEGHRVARFIGHLTLGGSYLGRPFRLLAWQLSFLLAAYVLLPDGRRKHRTVILGVARKNGKTQISAAIGLYHLCADTRDAAPEVVCAANTREQAKLLFREAARMVRASPLLADICTVQRDQIICHTTGGRFIAVSADAGVQQGLNPSCVIVDEYAQAKSSDLFDALTLGSAQRNEPLFLVISTAGPLPDGPFARLVEHGHRVMSGETDDPSLYLAWYGVQPGEQVDHTDPAVWQRCNPSWELMRHGDFADACKRTPEAAFRMYRLNAFVRGGTSWLPYGAWDALARPERRFRPGDDIVVAVDAAWRNDSTAILGVRLADLHVEVLAHWEAPDGDTHWRTPVHAVMDRIREVCRTYHVREVACDPAWFSVQLQTLTDEGLPMVEFPNSVARMVPATQQAYAAIVDGLISHNGNATPADTALARHLGNCVIKADGRGERITKESPTSRRHIDLAVAAVMALHRARLWREDVLSSSDGFLVNADPWGDEEDESW